MENFIFCAVIHLCESSPTAGEREREREREKKIYLKDF